MKIIHISDIHNDLEILDASLEAIKTNDAEVLAITGDLASSVFYGEEKKEFIGVSQSVINVYPQVYNITKGNIKTIHDTAAFLCSGKAKSNDELKKATEKYLEFEKIARNRMANQYCELKKRLDTIDKKLLIVPGNWDGRCIDEFFGRENIHSKYIEEFNGIKFVGYGGAIEHPIELPQDMTINFSDDEAFSYLSKHDDAEVALMHTPPKGFGNFGRYCMLSYLYRNTPSLILTGHCHTPYVCREEKTGTIIANSGNLGRYENQDFGTFLEIEINENLFVKPKRAFKVRTNRVEEYSLKEAVKKS